MISGLLHNIYLYISLWVRYRFPFYINLTLRYGRKVFITPIIVVYNFFDPLYHGYGVVLGDDIDDDEYYTIYEVMRGEVSDKRAIIITVVYIIVCILCFLDMVKVI